MFLFTETNEEIFKQPLLYTMGRKHFVLKQKAHSCFLKRNHKHITLSGTIPILAFKKSENGECWYSWLGLGLLDLKGLIKIRI